MHIHVENYRKVLDEATAANAVLVAVSKTKPVEAIQELYNLGHRDFGENYVQELVEKEALLPKDIRWHFIGHLQSNKVKYIAPFVHLIHGIDSFKLLQEVNRQAAKNKRVIDVLLQVHIAQEETKFGFNEDELDALLKKELSEFTHVSVAGLMGMASFTSNMHQVEKEFQNLKRIFDIHAQMQTSNVNFRILSMGMSADYNLALANGSTMIRVGSLLFGKR